MKKACYRKIMVSVLALALCFCTITSASASILNPTSCWTGRCGHKANTITVSNKTSSSRSTKVSIGVHAKPGVTTTVGKEKSKSKTSSWSITGSVGIDANFVQSTFGSGYDKTVTYSISQSITNNTRVDKTIGLEFKYYSKSCKLRNKHRTYYPYKDDALGWDNTCTFTTQTGTLKAIYYKSVGLCFV